MKASPVIRTPRKIVTFSGDVSTGFSQRVLCPDHPPEGYVWFLETISVVVDPAVATQYTLCQLLKTPRGTNIGSGPLDMPTPDEVVMQHLATLPFDAPAASNLLGDNFTFGRGLIWRPNEDLSLTAPIRSDPSVFYVSCQVREEPE